MCPSLSHILLVDIHPQERVMFPYISQRVIEHVSDVVTELHLNYSDILDQTVMVNVIVVLLLLKLLKDL